jgi:hypothetical protein
VVPVDTMVTVQLDTSSPRRRLMDQVCDRCGARSLTSEPAHCRSSMTINRVSTLLLATCQTWKGLIKSWRSLWTEDMLFRNSVSFFWACRPHFYWLLRGRSGQSLLQSGHFKHAGLDQTLRHSHTHKSRPVLVTRQSKGA